MRRAYFQRGGGGVFQCDVCGRNTRRVDQGDSRCCSECWELAGLDNSVNDRAQTWEEVKPSCEQLLADIASKGGNIEKAKAEFEYLWPTGEETK